MRVLPKREPAAPKGVVAPNVLLFKHLVKTFQTPLFFQSSQTAPSPLLRVFDGHDTVRRYGGTSGNSRLSRH